MQIEIEPYQIGASSFTSRYKHAQHENKVNLYNLKNVL